MGAGYYETPLGLVKILSDHGCVTWLQVVDISGEHAPDALTDEAHGQLMAYLSGKRRQFSLPLDPGGTDFQRQVWQALARIPYGQIQSYGQIAAKIGRETASRAVGAAIGRNPIWIFIPCHRVVGKDGQLTGYAGGLELKKKLLELERTWSVSDQNIK